MFFNRNKRLERLALWFLFFFLHSNFTLLVSTILLPQWLLFWVNHGFLSVFHLSKNSRTKLGKYVQNGLKVMANPIIFCHFLYCRFLCMWGRECSVTWREHLCYWGIKCSGPIDTGNDKADPELLRKWRWTHWYWCVW